jgi:hypothetical protein
MPRRYQSYIPLDPSTANGYEAWKLLQPWEKESWRWYATKVNSSGSAMPYDNYKRPADLFVSLQHLVQADSPDGWLHVAPGWLDWIHDPWRSRFGYEDKVKRKDPLAGYM